MAGAPWPRAKSTAPRRRWWEIPLLRWPGRTRMHHTDHTSRFRLGAAGGADQLAVLPGRQAVAEAPAHVGVRPLGAEHRAHVDEDLRGADIDRHPASLPGRA